MSKNEVPIWERYLLTIEQASALSGIGESTLRDRISSNNFDFTIKNGTRTLIKRKKFEKYLDSISVI